LACPWARQTSRAIPSASAHTQKRDAEHQSPKLNRDRRVAEQTSRRTAVVEPKLREVVMNPSGVTMKPSSAFVRWALLVAVIPSAGAVALSDGHWANRPPSPIVGAMSVTCVLTSKPSI
jgi:hypothetical protein